MGTPIVTTIETNMASAIAAMSVDGGYNLDWATVNQADAALSTFPSANVYLESEECLDEDTGGAWGGVYLIDALFRIDVDAPLDVGSAPNQSPEWTINARLNLALDDLKKLFGTNYTLDGAGGWPVMYIGSERVNTQAGDQTNPTRLTTQWKIRYTSRRDDPSCVE